MKVLIFLLAPVLALAASASEWTYRESQDEFSGTTTTIAVSPVAIGDPYGSSRVYVRCTDGKRLSFFITFGYLNRARDGDIAVKVGTDAPVRIAAMESADGTALFLNPGSSAKEAKLLNGMSAASSLAVRFTYYGHGVVTIKYGLTGSAKAISNVATACDLALDQ